MSQRPLAPALRVDDPAGVAEAFDEWIENLSSEEQAAARQYVKNARLILSQVGPINAKALVVEIFLYCQHRRPK